MGSPLFGNIALRGSSVAPQGLFGEPMMFSNDSRFLAVEQLMDAVSGPHVQAIVFDCSRIAGLLCMIRIRGYKAF